MGLVPLIKSWQLKVCRLPWRFLLHAPDDELRDDLIPVNSRWKVGQLLDAAHEYFEATGRRVSIEYALIEDMNDHAWRAQLLADELNKRGHGWAHVNPIPLNPTPGSIWTCSRPQVQQEFVNTCAGLVLLQLCEILAVLILMVRVASWPPKCCSKKGA